MGQRGISAGSQRRNGFTLVELMIAMAVGLVVLAAVYSLFIFQNKRYSIEEQIVEMQQNARAAMTTMVREIRMAGYDPNFDAASKVMTAAPTTFSFTTDDSSNNSTITYAFDSTNLKITRNINLGGGQPLAENIQSLAFTYYDADGTVTSTPSVVKGVLITITARTSKPDSSYSSNGGYRTYALSSMVRPRNL